MNHIINTLIKNQEEYFDNVDCHILDDYYPKVITEVFLNKELLSIMNIHPMVKCVEIYKNSHIYAMTRKLKSIMVNFEDNNLDQIIDFYTNEITRLLNAYKNHKLLTNNIVTFMPYVLIIPLKMDHDYYNFGTRFGIHYYE